MDPDRCAGAPTPEFGTLNAQNFEVVDEENRVRARLTPGKDSFNLTIMDSVGNERLVLGTQNEGEPSLPLLNAAGIIRTAVFFDGANTDVGLQPQGT